VNEGARLAFYTPDGRLFCLKRELRDIIQHIKIRDITVRSMDNCTVHD
jgi:hypothetical protein